MRVPDDAFQGKGIKKQGGDEDFKALQQPGEVSVSSTSLRLNTDVFSITTQLNYTDSFNQH